MIILVILELFSLPPRVNLIMLLRDLPKLSKMRRIVAFLPLNQIMGMSSRMIDLTNYVANLESSITFQHQGLHNKME